MILKEINFKIQRNSGKQRNGSSSKYFYSNISDAFLENSDAKFRPTKS